MQNSKQMLELGKGQYIKYVGGEAGGFLWRS